tara:strand:+ start:2062 stop:2628 length:567 start_codon:yes stop_codon:yes gene_type:complete
MVLDYNVTMENHLHNDQALERFCSRCGAMLVFRKVKASEPKRPSCTRCGHIVYLDPKVAVGTVITNEANQFALVKRSIEPGYGKWVYPGGYVDRGEQPTLAAVREAREEANLDVTLTGLINIYTYPGVVPIVLVYAATVIGGALSPEDESLEAAWFEHANIPWSELAFRSTHDALKDHHLGLLHPHLL